MPDIFNSPLHLLAAALLTATLFFSVVAFGAVAVDKRRARLRRWRVREGTLHLFELLGGWPGSLVGRRLFRHKTRDVRYRVVAAGIVGVHLLLWAVLVWAVLESRPAGRGVGGFQRALPSLEFVGWQEGRGASAWPTNPRRKPASRSSRPSSRSASRGGRRS